MNFSLNANMSGFCSNIHIYVLYYKMLTSYSGTITVYTMPVSQPAYSLIGNKIVSLALASTLIMGQSMGIMWCISYLHRREISIWLAGMCSSIIVSRISVFCCYTYNKLTYGTIQLQLHTTVIPQACYPTCFRHVYKASF